MILSAMAPAPSADLVGMLEMEDDNISLKQKKDTSAANLISKSSSSLPTGKPVAEPGKTPKASDEYRLQIVWRNVLIFAYLHAAAVYGVYLCFTSAKWATLLWAFGLHIFGGFGITGGAHRLWAHKSYKATWPARLFMAMCNTIAVQNDIYEWSRDHRVHHKFSETHADPHNAKRGFFFSHIGWLLCKKHPDVIRKGAGVDMSDLLQDPIVYYQRKFYIPLVILLGFVMPTVVPYYCWGETFRNGFFVAAILRYVVTLNVTWLVNSAAHLWGSQPYDKHINPAENLSVAFLTSGEGWHNYHHTFPWDYKAAELGNYRMNMTTGMLDLLAKFGLIYDCKTVPKSMVMKRVLRTGDGTHPFHHHHEEVPHPDDIPLEADEEEQKYCDIHPKED